MRLSTLATTAAAVAVTGAAGGRATGPAARSGWYARLKKPSFQPPARAFPIVWPILYTDIAGVSAATIDRLDDLGASGEARTYRAALGVNLVLNGSWSWVFFNRRRLGTAAVVAGLLTASSADLTRRSVAVRPEVGALLLPYPLWCAFATALSGRIWWLNRRRR
ncbi:TspO/MBR family protein [Mycolicibacterium thermoresistibile]